MPKLHGLQPRALKQDAAFIYHAILVCLPLNLLLLLLQGVEALTRHWLLDMCRSELAGADGQLSTAEANQGAIEGMTAALQLMEVRPVLGIHLGCRGLLQPYE